MNLLKVLAKVGSMTFVSRILGFVRDTLIARAFGASMLSDAFIVAFKIPNLLRRISAEGAFSQAFVPILGEYKSQRSFDETHALVSRVGTWLGSVSYTHLDVYKRQVLFSAITHSDAATSKAKPGAAQTR